MKPMGSRGFSLLEIVIVVFALSALAVLSLGGISGQRERATSFGMARVLAAELESARVRALKMGHPVAVCFPSGDGSTPQSQSFYQMEGEAKPSVTRQHIFNGDFPQSRVVNAFWGAAALPSSGTETKRAKIMASWLGSKAGKDYVLIFLPDGTVTSNDLPLTDGNYRLLVASGATYTKEELTGELFTPTPTKFKLTGALAGQTIQVSPAGKIQVISGVLEADGVTRLNSGPSTPADLAQLDLPADEASTEPAMVSIHIAPEPFLEPKATVQKERNLSLKVSAKDEDGDPLYCTWKAEAQGTSPGSGFFSLPDRHAMLWDRESGTWISESTWAPPPQCAVGDTYKLTCTITDPDGNQIEVEEEILDPVTIIPPGKIVGYNNYYPSPTLYVVNSDGTDFRNIVHGGTGGEVSPDGTKIAWRNVADSDNLWVGNLDGTGQKRVANIDPDKTSWSNDGRYLMACSRSHLQAVKADGSQITSLYHGAKYSLGTPTFTPNGNIVLFTSLRHTSPPHGEDSGQFVVAEFNDSGSSPMLQDETFIYDSTVPKLYYKFICWIPNTTREFFYTRRYGGYLGPAETVRAELLDSGSATDRFQINDLAVVSGDEFSHGIYDTTPVFSPDGNRVVLYRQNVGMFVADWKDLDNASLNTSNEKNFYSPAFGNHYIKAWVP